LQRRVQWQRFEALSRDVKEISDLPQVNHFAAEMDHFSACVRDNKQPDTPGEEGLKDMKVLDAIWRSVKSGKTEKV
jgi:predicted dehydrogenase